jgi:DNA-binding CsgD family transcriptional regulator
MAFEAERLRPLERRLLRLAEQGVDEAELARRFRRSPDHIRRVLDLARLPGRRGHAAHGRLRPLERRVLRWRELGAGFPELADRFGRSADGLAQVERLAHYKQARSVEPG